MQSNDEGISPNEIDRFLNSMNIIFYLAVCVPLLLFVLIFLGLQKGEGISPAFEPGDSFIHILLAFAVILLALPGYLFYKKKMKVLNLENNLKHKLQLFKDASIIKYLFFSTCSCVANALLFYFEEQIYLMAFAILLILFSIDRPTVYRIKKDAPLKKEEKVALAEYRKYL